MGSFLMLGIGMCVCYINITIPYDGVIIGALEGPRNFLILGIGMCVAALSYKHYYFNSFE